MYASLCWCSLLTAILLRTVGLWNATLALSEKGFYAMAFTLCLFASIAVQKTVRDLRDPRAPMEADRADGHGGIASRPFGD